MVFLEYKWSVKAVECEGSGDKRLDPNGKRELDYGGSSMR